MKLVKLNNIVSMYEKPVLGKVNSKKRFMALVVDKSTLKDKIKYGLAREITKSTGDVDIPGFIDESKLIIVKSKDILSWEKVEDLKIKEIEEVISSLSKEHSYFIGLEDPDIIVEKNIKHVFYTLAFKLMKSKGYRVYLGHAKGDNLKTLKATSPSLIPTKKLVGFKELCPIKTKDGFIFLNESIIRNIPEGISAVSLSETKNLNQKPTYKKIILNPEKLTYSWINGHASPCRVLLKNDSKAICLVNGREKTIKNKYGKFRPGLLIFDYKKDKVIWLDSKPLLEDPDATTITFASDFIKTSKDKGILYCHINDSFVRAYQINLKELNNYIKLSTS